jgi:hypothetical protein
MAAGLPFFVTTISSSRSGEFVLQQSHDALRYLFHRTGAGANSAQRSAQAGHGTEGERCKVWRSTYDDSLGRGAMQRTIVQGLSHSG